MAEEFCFGCWASQSRLSSFSRSSGTDRIEVAPYVAVIRRTFILPGHQDSA
jgi:hypothetical protein